MSSVCTERTIARHQVAEVEQRHNEDTGRESSPPADKDDVVIIYNRVPKTASTSFTNIAYDLCGENRFHVLHINTTKNNPVMSLQDQVRPSAIVVFRWSGVSKSTSELVKCQGTAYLCITSCCSFECFKLKFHAYGNFLTLLL